VAIIKRSATRCIQNNWNQVVPAQVAGDEYKNTDGDPFAPNMADYNGTTIEFRTHELGRFDFSDIPPGSTITRITVRKLKEAEFVPPVAAGVAEILELKVTGTIRHSKKWFVDTTGLVPPVIAMDYPSPNITRDELATVDAFTVETTATHGKLEDGDEPPRFET